LEWQNEKKCVRYNKCKEKSKPWFDETCKLKRKQYIKGRRNAKYNKGNVIFNNEKKSGWQGNIRKQLVKVIESIKIIWRNPLEICNVITPKRIGIY
jgi:hypothetical protein